MAPQTDSQQAMLERIRGIADSPGFLEFETKFGEGGLNPDLFGQWPVALAPASVEQLKAQGCHAADWAKVRLAPGCPLERLRAVHFEGYCLVGNLSGAAVELLPGIRVTPGLENARLCDVMIGDGCAVRDVSLLSRTDVQRDAVVMNCGLIAGGELNTLGLEREIVFAPGSGGRQLPVLPGMTSELLAWLASRPEDSESLLAYRELCARYRARFQRNTALIGRGARLFGARRILRSAIGPETCVDDAEAVEDTIVCSAPGVRSRVGTGAILKRCTLNPGVEVTDGAYAENTHFCDRSWARGGARITSSIIGERSGVTNGECRTSFLGPLVDFHHQALVIATYWPGGRGNVSYGAMIGANHTGRAPDQEHWAGEGVFYGLGTAIKFPANYTDSPYTLIAGGVSTLPERVQFPFSLINKPSVSSPYIPPAYNELLPGWAIEQNLYGLFRQERRWRANLDSRAAGLETRILRPQFLPLVADALRRLRQLDTDKPEGTLPSGELFYCEHQAPGLGKNFLRETERQKGIFSYEFALSLIQALEVLRLWESGLRNPTDRFASAELEAVDPQVRATYPEDFTRGLTWAEAVAAAMPYIEHAVALIRTGRKSTDSRGRRIIPDYQAVHGAHDSDALVRELEGWLEAPRRASGEWKIARL